MQGETASAIKMFRQFLVHLPPGRRRQLILLFVLMLIGSLAEIVTIGAVVPFLGVLAKPEAVVLPMPLEWVFKSVGLGDRSALVVPMSVTFVTIVLLATGIRLLLLYASNRLVFAIGRDLGVKLYSKILRQPYNFHIANNTSEVIADVNKVEMVIGGFVRPAMEGAIALIIGVAILSALLLVDAAVALGSGALFLVIYLAIVLAFRSKLRANSGVISETQGARIRLVQEGLGGIRDIILDGSHGYYIKNFTHHDRLLRKSQAENAFLSQAPRFLVETLGITVIVGLACVLSLEEGGLMASLPTLGALALGAARLLPLTQKAYLAWALYSGNLSLLKDVLRSLNLPSVEDRIEPNSVVIYANRIELREIEFRHSSDTPYILRGVSVNIVQGSRIGIVGPTGGGKSTLLDIIMGLLVPTSGVLLVDGKAINDTNRLAWQARIAHVPQHIFLLDGTIAENIAFGEDLERSDTEKIRDAARIAQISSFIETQPKGYDVQVGERGIQLSGGQRQRIGIARALYKNADVLIFDEASSALDTETERALMDAIDGMDRKLTIIMVAHRLQSLRGCDEILRLEHGQLVSV